ncbi:MAG: ABC transporter substrate-binding protein [Emergencia sp.]|nr:ABC transporter substrate-binding protein [Emergencia sp.]
MKKKIFSLVLMAALVLTALTGCGSDNKEQGELDTSAPIETTVGTWKTAQTLTPYFYEDYLPEGSSIEVKPFTNPGDQKTALLAGSLDMTGTTIPLAITAASMGEPIKIVTTLCNKCSALVVRKDSGIKKAEDLKGKTIAYVPGTMHHALLLNVLEKAGLDPEKDVTLTRIDFFDMAQALSDGTIDAFLSGEPYPSQAVKDGYGTILSYPYFDDSIGTINAAMIVTEDTIKNNPALVQTLVNAHIQGAEFINANQDVWLEKAASFGTDLELLKLSADNIEICWDIDEAYIENVRNLAEQMLELGMIEKVPDIEAMFDLSFIENYKAENK